MIRALSLAVMIAALALSAQASAQCSGVADIGVNSSDPANGVWVGPQTAAKSSLTAEFYLKPISTLNLQEFFLNDAGTTTEPLVGIRVDSSNWEFLDYSGDTPSWIDPSAAAPTIGDWWAFEVDLESNNRCYKVRMRNCTTCGSCPAWSSWYGPYGRCDNDLPGSDLPVIVSYYGITNTVNPTDFELDDLTWTLAVVPPNCEVGAPCHGPISCEDAPATWTPCDAYSISPFCDGQSETYSALGPWDIFMQELFPTANAVALGGVPSDSYSTAKIGGCSGMVVGPHTVLYASHCEHTERGGLLELETDPASELWIDSVGIGTKYQIRRIDIADRGEAWPLDYDDVAFAYTHEAMPGPYVNELYDYTDSAERANCTDIISQGFSTGANLECNYAVLYERKTVPDGQYSGWCVDPWIGYPSGGDSGGPLYAIGDWDGAGGGAPYAKVLGPQGGSYIWNHHEDIRNAGLAFWNANKDGPVETLLTVNEIDFVDVEAAYADGLDIDIEDVPVTCRVTATSSGSAIAGAGCEFHQGGTPLLSCADATPTGDLYECDITLPQDSSSDWVARPFVTTVAGDTRRADTTRLKELGVYRLDMDIGSIPAAEIPVPTAMHVGPKNPAPGGEAICIIEANAVPSLTGDTGCIYQSGTIHGHEKQAQRAQPGRIFRSSVTVPSDTSPGTTLTMDSAYGYSTAHGWSGLLSVTGESTTVFDCTTVSPDASKVGPGLLASQTYASVVGGYASVFEAYLRVSSTSQNATWLVAEGAITAEADALTGVRFNSSGVVEFLDDGVWSADSAFNYSEDTWYRVRFETEDLTAPVNPYTAVYQGYIAPCGSTFTKVRADAVIGDGTRLLQGMEEWTIGSADVSQTIEIKHNDWVIGNCIPTQCAWESGWGGGSGAPDGCGDTLPGCGGP